VLSLQNAWSMHPTRMACTLEFSWLQIRARNIARCQQVMSKSTLKGECHIEFGWNLAKVVICFLTTPASTRRFHVSLVWSHNGSTAMMSPAQPGLMLGSTWAQPGLNPGSFSNEPAVEPSVSDFHVIPTTTLNERLHAGRCARTPAG